MLFNPNWKAPKVKHKFMTLGSLIAWLETKPADEEYWYVSPSSCLIAQYRRAHGHFFAMVGPRSYGFILRRRLPYGFNTIAQGTYDNRGHTFGAALERARLFQAQEW